MRFVNIDNLKPGMINAQNLIDDNGILLLAAHAKLTPFMIKTLKENQYIGLFISDKLSSGVKSKHLLSDRTTSKTLAALSSGNLEKCLEVANEITDSVLESESIQVNFVNMQSYDAVTYRHSLNVAVLATVIGISSGLRYDVLQELTKAALLHDVGKLEIPLEILRKPGELSNDEMVIMKKHSKLGYEILKKNINISSVVRNAVYSHHENVDGSGYPRNLVGRDIHYFAKIIHVADVYDALISARSYKSPMNPADALEFLMGDIGTMFDIDYVNALAHNVIMYPLGVTVELSTGELGIVIGQHRDFPTRPDIRLFNGLNMSLLEHPDLTIVRIRYDVIHSN